MTDKIGAHFGAVEGTHAHLVSAVATMNSKLSDLKRDLAPMVATWEGEASANYQALQRQWDAAAADLNDILSRVAGALDDGKVRLQGREKANAARFQG